MRVLVTGASGFAGKPLCDWLSADGFEVRAALRDVNSQPRAAEVVTMPDMSAPFDAARLVSGCDAVVHVAGLAHSSGKIPEATYMAVNCDAARTLAQASREAGVKRFIFISSVRAQSGPSASARLTENDAPQPSDAYGRSKLAGERAVLEVLRGSPTAAVVLRPVLMYGPRPKGNMATLMRLARMPWLLPIGGLKARRSLLGIANFASAVSHALRAEACAGGTFLLADGAPLTVAQTVAAFRKALGRPPGIVALPLSGAGGLLSRAGKRDLAARLFGDLTVSTAAFAKTGWTPPKTTAQGLADAING